MSNFVGLLLSNQNNNCCCCLATNWKNKVEWVEVIMEVWQWVARGNIQQTSCNSPLRVYLGIAIQWMGVAWVWLLVAK